MLIIYLFTISMLCSFIIDYSGFIDAIESFVRSHSKSSMKFFKVPKPFSCSLCMSFWIGLTLLILESANVTRLDYHEGFNIAYIPVLLLSCILTNLWPHLFYFIQDFSQQIINYLRKWTRIQ